MYLEWKILSEKKKKQPYKSEKSISIFETVPQIEKLAMLGFMSGLSFNNNRTSRQ